MIKVRFVQRNHITEQTLPAGIDVRIVHRSNHVFGGPRECELELTGDAADMMETLDWLRCRVEVYDDAQPVWWGVIKRVEVPVNRVRLSVDMDGVANAVKGAYTLTNSSGQPTGVRQDTVWVENAESIAIYGRKELLLSLGDMNAVQADLRVRRELNDRAFPRVHHEPDEGNAVARIYAIGEWETLGWQYANVPTNIALAFQNVGDGTAVYNLTAPEIKVAQSFKVVSDFQLADISLYLSKVGGPGDLTVEILDYVAEDMPGDVLTSVTIPAELVGTSASWVKAVLSQAYSMTAGKRYFLAISARWCDLSNYYRVALDSNHGYPEGTFRINVSSGWQTFAPDVPFRMNQNVLYLTHSAVTSLYRKLDNVTAGYAQQFTTAAAKSLTEAAVRVRRVGDPGQLSITLHKDNANAIGDQVATATLQAIDVSETISSHRALFDAAPSQPAGKYWLVMAARQADAINYYEFQMDGGATYTGGIAMHRPVALYVDGGADMPFKTAHSTLAAAYTTTTASTLTLSDNAVRYAQSFRTAASTNAGKVRLYLRKVGNPGNISVSLLATDTNGLPGAALGSATIEGLDVGTGMAWYDATLSNFPQLAAFTPYFVEITASGLNGSNYYVLQVDGNGGYPGETAWSYTANAWAQIAVDIPFQISGATAGVSWGNAVNSARQIGGTYASVAQQFQAGTSADMLKLDLQVRKTGNPGDLSVGLYADSGGWPGALLDSYTIDRRTIGASYAWVSGWLAKQPAVNAGSMYWIKVSANNADSVNYYEVGVDLSAGYSGLCKLEQSGTWASQTFDMPFQVFEPSTYHQHTTGAATGKLGVDWPMLAQKVVPPATFTLTSVGLWLAKVGQPGNVQIDVAVNDNGFPGEVLGTATIPASAVGVSAAFVMGALERPLVLTYNAQGYYLVVRAAGTSAISYYTLTLDATASYAAGAALQKSGDVWAPGAGDMPFRLYANSMVETGQQIQALLTSYGQFFAGVYMNSMSGVISESYRSGDTDALTEIEKLLEGGTSNQRRLLARVNFDRTVEVFEQQVQPLNPMVEWRDDGRMYYRSGAGVESTFDPTGKYVSLEPVLRSARFVSVVTGSQNEFIDWSARDADGFLSTTATDWVNPNNFGKVIDG